MAKREQEALSVSVSAQTGGHITAPVLQNNIIHGDLTFTTIVSGGSNPPDTHTQSPDLTSLSLKYKELVKSEYAYVTEYNSLPGEDVRLTDRYTELLIIQRHRDQSEREKEIRSRGEVLFSARDSEKYSNISVEQFFSPDDHGLIPKAVVLQGNSGNGKSFTAQKIMLDWASGKLYAENFDFIFHLKCKEINQTSGEMSLVELLRYNQSLTPAQITQTLQHTPERVLFLMDGFDELKLSQDDMSNLPLPPDVQTPASPESTLKALLSGRLLPESFLLITTRSTATDTLSKLLKKPKQFTEIMGFSEGRVEEYFRKFFKDDQLLQTQAYEHVKANETLFTACSIPVICWIICTVFREKYQDDKNTINYLDTATSIYVDFVSTLLEHHCQALSHSVPSLLRSLGQLAERGMLKQQVLFDKKNVSETVSDPAKIPFLCKFLVKRRIHQETMFSFMHLSFQEFFTALYYGLLTEEESQRVVRELLEPLEKSWYAQESKNKQHLLPVIQFLCGLSNKEVSISLQETHNLLVSPSIQAQLVEWICQVIKKTNTRQPFLGNHAGGQSKIFIFYCLYEFHEEEFLRKAMESWEYFNLSFYPLRRTDCWVLQYCLHFCPRIRRISFRHCSLTPEKLKILQPAVCRSEELDLGLENVSDDDVGVLVSALGEGKDLIYLGMVQSALSEEGLQQVLSSLSKQNSLSAIDLRVKSITTNTAVMLKELLQNKPVSLGIGVKMTESNVTSFCTSLAMLIADDYFTLSVEDYRYIHGLSESPRTAQCLSLISVSCPLSEISNINWTKLAQIFNGIKLCSENSPEVDGQLDALLSFLYSVPEVLEVTLIMRRLTESWASKIFSFIQTCPTLQGFSATVKKNSNESLCSFLRVGVTQGDFWLSVKYDRFEVCLTCPHSEISNIDWKTFTQIISRIRDSTEKCTELGEQFDALLSFLNSVPGLKEVDLNVSRLNESWADRILSLIQNCPSLREISFAAGEDGKGLLLEEGIRLLQHSQIRQDCTLTVEGRRCIKPTDQCTEDMHTDLTCNQTVKLHFSGESFTVPDEYDS